MHMYKIIADIGLIISMILCRIKLKNYCPFLGLSGHYFFNYTFLYKKGSYEKKYILCTSGTPRRKSYDL